MTLGTDSYGEVRDLIRNGGSVDEAVEALLQLWTDRYEAQRPVTRIEVLQHGSAEYLFDRAEDTPATFPDRTIAAYGFPQRAGKRDVAYQSGYPMHDRFTRYLDRGHMFPHTAGGLFGPNIFPQDRTLNQGRSVEGRRYRAMETLAATNSLFFFCALVYCDNTDMPAFVELGVVENLELRVEVFRNRFDPVAIERFPIDVETWLACLTDRELADLGEETARNFIEVEFGETIVALGDSEMRRDEGRQDQDIVAIIDGELTAIEVKTRYLAKRAGALTRAGNLYRPRLQPSGSAVRQGSQAYAAARLAQFADDDGDFRILVALVDLKAFRIQFYEVENGRMIQPLDAPVDCRKAVMTAVDDLRRYAETPKVDSEQPSGGTDLSVLDEAAGNLEPSMARKVVLNTMRHETSTL